MQSCRLGGALHTIYETRRPARDTDTVRAFGKCAGAGWRRRRTLSLAMANRI
jgi:hypothetical protein